MCCLLYWMLNLPNSFNIMYLMLNWIRLKHYNNVMLYLLIILLDLCE